jgi:octaprenyl-diphosphate synthase
MAFQIKDDLFDYQKANNTGKPSGIDIRDKKMTLPLIYLIGRSSSGEKRKLINVIKNHNTNPDRVSDLIKKVVDCGGIEYAQKKMNAYKDNALKILDEFDDSPARRAMTDLVNYTIERDK